MLRGWLGVDEGEADVAARTKARAHLQPDVLPALGRLLSLRVEEGDGLDLPDALVRWVESLAFRGPVVVALEDLHWADQGTRELAERRLEVTDRAPVLVVMTFEPDPASEA